MYQVSSIFFLGFFQISRANGSLKPDQAWQVLLDMHPEVSSRPPASSLRFHAKDNGKDKASSIMALVEMERDLHDVCPAAKSLIQPGSYWY